MIPFCGRVRRGDRLCPRSIRSRGYKRESVTSCWFGEVEFLRGGGEILGFLSDEINGV